MSQFVLHSYLPQKFTLISNQFLDLYMPKANGEFVKIYLYLLRASGETDMSMELSSIADTLHCTENDVLRGLRYWEQEKLLSLSFGSSGQLMQISFLPPEAACTAAASPSPGQLSLDELHELQKDETVSQLLFVASQYLGKTLTPVETEKILYFYQELKLSPDLIEYLIESCVAKNHPSIYYMEKIALSWAEKGVQTVEAAKQNNSCYHKDYYRILKALGITGREPVEAEITLMNIWLQEYGFTLDIITEACQRAAMQTFRPGLKYANGILKDWYQRGVRHISDIHTLTQKNGSSPQDTCPPFAAAKDRKNRQPGNRFNNFPQREQDFSQLEQKLLHK